MRTKLVVFMLMCVTLGAWAQTGPGPAILILFPAPDGALETRLRAELKAARDEVGLTRQEAPIQRLYWSVPNHRQKLESLGLTPDKLPWVGFGQRGSEGWPQSLEERLPSSHSAADIIDRFAGRYLRGQPRWGLLLVDDRARPDWQEERRHFVREVGLLVHQRRGEVSGSEVPTFAYDLSEPGQARYVREGLGLQEEAPFAVVAEFEGDRPVRTVGQPASMLTPALSSRLLWGTLQGAKPGAGESVPPGPATEPIIYSIEGLVVCVIRSHELSTQLYESVKHQPLGEDRRARQDLLGIVENSGILRQELEQGVERPLEAVQRLLANAADFRSNQGSLRLDPQQRELLRLLLQVLTQTEAAQRQLFRR